MPNGIRGSDGEEIQVEVPLQDWVKQVSTHAAREAARYVVKDHSKSCPARTGYEDLSEQVRKGEIARWKILVLMAACGGIGGGGAVLARIVGG